MTWKTIKPYAWIVGCLGMVSILCVTDLVKEENTRDLAIQASVSISFAQALEADNSLKAPVEKMCQALSVLIDSRTTDSAEVKKELYDAVHSYTGNKELTLLLVTVLDRYNHSTAEDPEVEIRIKRLKAIRSGLLSALTSMEDQKEEYFKE